MGVALEEFQPDQSMEHICGEAVDRRLLPLLIAPEWGQQELKLHLFLPWYHSQELGGDDERAVGPTPKSGEQGRCRNVKTAGFSSHASGDGGPQQQKRLKGEVDARWTS